MNEYERTCTKKKKNVNRPVCDHSSALLMGQQNVKYSKWLSWWKCIILKSFESFVPIIHTFIWTFCTVIVCKTGGKNHLHCWSTHSYTVVFALFPVSLILCTSCTTTSVYTKIEFVFLALLYSFRCHDFAVLRCDLYSHSPASHILPLTIYNFFPFVLAPMFISFLSLFFFLCKKYCEIFIHESIRYLFVP